LRDTGANDNIPIVPQATIATVAIYHPRAAQVLCGFRAPSTKKANSINAISVAVSDGHFSSTWPVSVIGRL
jgi:hypothetical protein